jgi:hypothetical protein
MAELKEDIGGGDYALRLMAENKVRKTIHFSIMKEKAPLVTEKRENGDMMMMMFQMMMKQSEDAARARAEDMRDRQAASERQTTMLVGLASAAIPALMGGREKTSELMQAIAALQTRDTGGGMKDTLEMLTTAKTLFGDKPSEDNKFDAEDLVGSAMKLGGPLVGAIGKAFSERRGTASNPATGEGEQAPALMLPSAAPEAGARGPSDYPVLDLIREDVLFLYKRNHDPEKAADIVYDVIEAAQVPEDDINALVASFSISADWLGDLAAQGIDLRGRPEWAQQFLQALVGIHSEAGEQSDDFAGHGRDAADISANGEAGEAGRSADAGPQSGG